jgi:hypothetical protein
MDSEVVALMPNSLFHPRDLQSPPNTGELRQYVQVTSK